MIAGERNLDLALTGRRATECELEILMLLDRDRERGSHPPDRLSPASPKGTDHSAMRDLPAGPALLALARDVLLRDLMPLLPHNAHLEARLVANSMAIAERELAMGDGPGQEILHELEKLYGEPGSGKTELLVRLAHDLRDGAFESSALREHEARQILWRLTIAKLRSANPRFLNANGFN